MIFWIVNKVNKISHLQLLDIEGNQLWKGAAPNLIPNLIKKINVTKIVFTINILQTIPKIKIKDANVWVKKYLIEDSLEILFFSRRSKGIKAKVFNSSPTQDNIKEDEEITKKILIRILSVNNTTEGVRNIGKKV